MGMINFIGGVLKEKDIYGGQICICKGNRFEYIFGSKSTNITDFVQSDTLYDTASLTKVLVTMPIVCKLVSAGEVSFDTKLKDILPEFKYDDITLYDVLSHQSGLASTIYMVGKQENRNTLINEILQIDKKYEPGTNVEYSDIAYILLGLGLERIYGKGLDQIAREEIFEPLEMSRTCYNPVNKDLCAPTEYMDGKLCIGTVHDWKARLMDGVAGHAGVFSTAHDIGNYIDMVLNHGSYKNKQIISEELIDEYWFKNLVYEPDASRYRSLCYIVGNNSLVLRGNSEEQISFHGFTGPSISIDRENNIGIAMLTNSTYPSRERRVKLNGIRADIIDSIYEDYGKVYKK